MSGFSQNLAAKVINHFFRPGNSVTATAATYVSLHTADPTDVTATARANEISAAWYARQSVTLATATLALATVTTTNTNVLTWSAVTGAAVTATHWAVWDGSGGGAELLGSGALDVSRTLNINDYFVIAASTLVLTFL